MRATYFRVMRGGGGAMGFGRDGEGDPRREGRSPIGAAQELGALGSWWGSAGVGRGGGQSAEGEDKSKEEVDGRAYRVGAAM
jgi:hypothetical protein